MKKLKGLLSFLLVLAILSSCFIQGVFAAGTVYNAKINVKYGQTDARKICDMINDMRKSSEDAWCWNEDNSAKVSYSGLADLSYDYSLEKIAMQRAAEVALKFDHVRTNGEICFSAFNEFKYNCSNYGENIAAGSSTAEGANKQWREDDEDYSGQGHRRNMLEKNYNTVGIGHVKYNSFDYWVEVFAYTASVDTNETPAVDTDTIADVKISEDIINNVSITTESSKINAKLKKEIDTPTLKTELSIAGHFPSSYKCEIAEFDKDLSITDTDIASIKDGKIYGNKLGDTKYNVSAFGKNTAFDLNVSCEHEYELTSTKEPSCTEDGLKTFTCKICGDIKTEPIEKLGHNMTNHAKIDADCTKKGQKEYWHCERCDKNFFDAAGATIVESEADLEIPITEHSYVVDSEKKATCTKWGVKTYKCSVCGDTYSEDIAPTGHSMIYHAASEPTCEHKGNREYWYCENCKKTFLDKDGNTTIDSNDIELPKLDHIIESIGKTVKATHFNAGSTAGTKCSVCGKVFKKTAKIAKKTFGKITLKKGKKQFKATWKKIGGASGFQIKYSLKSNFTSAKGKTFKGRGITIKKLKSKKTYYVKVRAFKIVNKKKVYSDWSKVGSVKTK